MKIFPALILAFVCLSFPRVVICQNVPAQIPAPKIIADLQTPDLQGNRVSVTQDQEIARLIFYYTENQQKQEVKGYRILIFSEKGPAARQNGEAVRSRFYREFPAIRSYLSWDSPNFKVYVGDFRTKTEALRNHKQIARSYPNATISTQINITPQQ